MNNDCYDNPRRNPEHYRDDTAYSAIKAVTRDERGYPRVYICSPFRGDSAANTLKTLQYCRFALKRGFFPIAPHVWLPRFMRDGDPAERELALSFGERLLRGCRAIWVFGDVISAGMAREIKSAERNGIPIRRFNSKCKEL
jgi:hypothetical protein